MKLLLDEMHSPRIADTLIDEGWDVIAVAADADLRGLTDRDLFENATSADRALVTENIADFSLLSRQWMSAGRDHSGLLFTHPRKFHRASLAYPGNLISVLQQFLETCPIAGVAWTWWL